MTESLRQRIITIVSEDPGCPLEAVVAACPQWSWSQVFLEVDRLSRAGSVRLQLVRRGVYTLSPAHGLAA
ncbi:hypothetical protein [Candidatus Nitrospira bockiana]